MENTALLAFDCATSGASIALRAGGKTYTRALAQGKQAGELISSIDALMRETGITYANLAAIVTTTGPGSFTGLRIGLAALHGLVLVHRTPIKTLTTLEAMAWHITRQANAPTTFTTAIRAGKGELYIQEFTQKNQIPSATSDISLVPETYDGWRSPHYSNNITADAPNYLPGPNSETLCLIADQLPTSTLADALPLYIRPPDAIIPHAHPWLQHS